MSNSIFKQNYFEIFSQPVSTELDIDLLKEKNRELQQQVHPDRFANSSDAEKRQAMQITSLVNEAFETLKNSLTRLQYMLTLKGVDMNGETDTAMDGVFLMEQMELREEIANVDSQKNSLDVLDEMALELKARSVNLVSDFESAFNDDALDKGRDIVRKLQFINKAQIEINDKIEQIEDEFI